MKSILFAAVAVLFSVQGQASAGREILTKACSDASRQAVFEQFAKDANIEIGQVNRVARIFEPFLDEDADTGLTIDVNSQDNDVWNGYAVYFATVQEIGNSCQVVSLKILGSEGL